jgi:hypothetical protein
VQRAACRPERRQPPGPFRRVPEDAAHPSGRAPKDCGLPVGTSAGGATERSRGASVSCEPPVCGANGEEPWRGEGIVCRSSFAPAGALGAADLNRRLAGSPPATFLRPSGPHNGPSDGRVRASEWLSRPARRDERRRVRPARWDERRRIAACPSGQAPKARQSVAGVRAFLASPRFAAQMERSPGGAKELCVGVPSPLPGLLGRWI